MDSRPNWTPGPWRTWSSDDQLIVRADAENFPDIAYLGAELRTGSDQWTPQEEANARLITAAPDLLAALKFVLAFYEPNQHYLDTEAWKVAIAQSRAAIARAEGKS